MSWRCALPYAIHDDAEQNIFNRYCGMVYGTLICSCNFADFYQLALFRTCFDGSQNRCFFLCAHIAMISTVMIARNRFKRVAPIFCHQMAHTGRTETCCLSHILGTGTFGPQFQRFQSGLGPFILIFLARLLDRFYFFITQI